MLATQTHNASGLISMVVKEKPCPVTKILTAKAMMRLAPPAYVRVDSVAYPGAQWNASVLPIVPIWALALVVEILEILACVFFQTSAEKHHLMAMELLESPAPSQVG